jgi:hypothetical protein
MERPAKCQCLTSSPSSNAPLDRSQSAGASSSSPSEANPASNNKDTTNTTANHVPPCNKQPTQGKEADDRAQNMVSTDGQEMEYDECEPANTAPPPPCPDWNRGMAYHFDKLSGVIKHLVSASFCSKGLWAQVPRKTVAGVEDAQFDEMANGHRCGEKKQGAIEKDRQGMPPIQEAVVH